MKTRFRKISVILVIALSLIWAAAANAQNFTPTFFNAGVPAGFCMSGMIQEATLNNPAPTAPGSGGTLTMNGIKMFVPGNSVVQMPANTLRWAQLFDPAVSAAIYDNSIPPQVTPPINHPAGMTGLALADAPATFPPPAGTYPGPFPCFNAIVFGNIDIKGTAGFGARAYIVGLILPIDQDLGNLGAGFITAIDYAKGRFEVNGIVNTLGTGTVIEINDPVGRFGKAHSPDPRWSADTENPTVNAGNGYPMGIAKVAPPAIDPDRPWYNRPWNPGPLAPNHDPFLPTGYPLQAFFMPAKPSPAPNPAGVLTPDPWRQAPFMIGDYVSWAGVLVKFNPVAPITPFNSKLPVGPGNLPLNQQLYISANTVSSDKLAIYTQPGTVAQVGPCYLSGPIGHSIVGTGGVSITVPPNPTKGIIGGVIPIIEPKNNIAVHGWCTDSTALVDIYAVDIDPATGKEVTPLRLMGTVLPEPGFAAGKGNKGRFRLDVGKTGNIGAPTRTYRIQSQHGTIKLPNQVGLNGAALPGLNSGMYTFPQFGFQFADAPPGFPNVPNNFQVMNFLTLGEGGNLSGGPLLPMPPTAP